MKPVFSGDEVAALLGVQGAVFLALLLIGAALHKVTAWTRLLGVAEEFAGVPHALAAPAVGAAAAAEGLLGIALLLPTYRTLGAVGAALIFTGYGMLLAHSVLTGRTEVDCGCSFGFAAKQSARALGPYHLLRNALLIAIALGVAAVSAVVGTMPMFASQMLAGCVLLALYAAVDQVMTLQSMRSGEIL